LDRRSEAIAQLLETALEERFDVAPLDLDVARLRELNAAKTEFLSMAAHELRTPLSVILGYGSLLAQGGRQRRHPHRSRRRQRLLAAPGDTGTAR
jgi:signal transduction histidine kinase